MVSEAVSHTVVSENFTVDIYDDGESGSGRSKPYDGLEEDEVGGDVYDEDEGGSIESIGSEHDLPDGGGSPGNGGMKIVAMICGEESFTSTVEKKDDIV